MRGVRAYARGALTILTTAAALTRLVALAAAAAVALATAAPPARADGDPASDALLVENVFYPYNPKVSAELQSALNAETAAASRARFPIKVALIATPVDLGAIPGMFGHPQQYADFLDEEISENTRQLLLVVMAGGYGVRGLPAGAARALSTLPKPASGRSDDLARAAIGAVHALAGDAGHPLGAIAAEQPAAGAGRGSAGATAPIAVLCAIAAAGVVVLAVRRRRASSGS